MRTKRLKKASRILTFFHFNYGFSPPYTVLLDGTFCQAALKDKINLREQMPKYLADEVEMCVTKCVINELEHLGKEVYGALVICRQFRIAKCPHKPMRTAGECIAHLARRSKSKGNIDSRCKYFIATQDTDLLEKVRTLGGVPLLSIRRNTIILEKPSAESKEAIDQQQETALTELDRVKEMKAEVFGEQNKLVRKRKRPKGPNPLSCKKKKKKTGTMGNQASIGTGGVPGAFGKKRPTRNNSSSCINSEML